MLDDQLLSLDGSDAEANSDTGITGILQLPVMPVICTYRCYRYRQMHRINSPVQIGRMLISRRKALGISQSALAAKLAVSQQRLSELETQPGSLTVERLTVWLNLLKLDLAIGEHDAQAKSSSKVEW